MTIGAMKSVLAVLTLFGSATVLAGEATAHSDQARGGGGWVCNAYGWGGSRGQWRTITGEREASRAKALESATQECQKRLNGCQRSGCWSGE